MYLLFDIGGTKMRFAFSQDGKKLGSIITFDTSQSFEEGINRIHRQMRILSKGKRLKAIAGGIAGPLNHDKSRLVNAPNLQDWIQKPLKHELQNRLEAPVYLENDAALVGLGEAVYGAGKNMGIVVYITVSTGVGGARIVDGKIDRNAMGFEPGHQIIEKEGILCPGCNVPGHLEGYISGTAVKKRFGKDPEKITDPKIWDEVANLLAIGVHNTILHWSPDAVVIGGSMMKSISIEKVTADLHKILTIFPKAPIIKRAELGDTGGLYGALSLVQNL